MLAEREPLVGTQHVAAFLGIPAATLAQWRYRGVGPRGYRVGRHVKYRMSEIEQWLEAQAGPNPTR
ncbi:hypothetical protein BH20ACT9_BH20ACT9_06000 [soil metagenome]